MSPFDGPPRARRAPGISIALLTSAVTLLATRPARADGQGALSFLGGTGSGNDQTHGMALAFTVGPSFTDFHKTNAFRGLPGAPSSASVGGWSVGVLFGAVGAEWTVFAANRFAFGSTSDQGGGAELHRSFSLDIPFSVGWDLGTKLKSPLRFAPGVGLLAHVGPKQELTVADGGKISFATVSVPIGPSVVFGWTPQDGSGLLATAGIAPTKEFLFAHVTGIDASGSLATYQPKQTDPSQLGKTYQTDVNGLHPTQLIWGSGMLYLSAFAIRVDYVRTKLAFSGSAPGWNDGFVDQAVHVSIGFGGASVKF